MNDKQIEESVKALKCFKRVFETEDGEKVLEYLKQDFHFYTQMYAGDNSQLAFREGQRSVVLTIMKQLELDPDKYRKSLETDFSKMGNSIYDKFM